VLEAVSEPAMPHWRKMTWAIVIWTVLCIAWVATGVGAVSNSCAGLSGTALSNCQAATVLGGGIGVSLIFFVWFIVFIVMSIIWFMTRPRNSVLIYGPEGQQMSVSEAEAKKRVEKARLVLHPTDVASRPPSPPVSLSRRSRRSERRATGA
jgi:hypothetical protein